MDTMKDQKYAGQLASAGLEHFRNGRFKQAAVCYSDAIEHVEHRSWEVVDYHDEYAEVLARLGKQREARSQLENSLKLAMQISEQVTSYEVTYARHQLAEHLVKTGFYQQALDTVKPFLGKGCDSDWMLYLSAAAALKALGDNVGAKIAALAVLTKVPGDNRWNVEQQLIDYLE